jgi:hypothetical protein
MKIDRGIEAILRFCVRNFRECNVGISDGRYLLSAPLKWVQCHDIHTKFHED